MVESAKRKIIQQQAAALRPDPTSAPKRRSLLAGWTPEQKAQRKKEQDADRRRRLREYREHGDGSKLLSTQELEALELVEISSDSDSDVPNAKAQKKLPSSKDDQKGSRKSKRKKKQEKKEKKEQKRNANLRYIRGGERQGNPGPSSVRVTQDANANANPPRRLHLLFQHHSWFDSRRERESEMIRNQKDHLLIPFLMMIRLKINCPDLEVHTTSEGVRFVSIPIEYFMEQPIILRRSAIDMGVKGTANEKPVMPDHLVDILYFSYLMLGRIEQFPIRDGVLRTAESRVWNDLPEAQKLFVTELTYVFVAERTRRYLIGAEDGDLDQAPVFLP